MGAILGVLLSGIVASSIYALVATGFSLCFGTIRVFNFAHGALLMLGAYLAWLFYSCGLANSFLGYVGPIILVCIVMFLIGMALEGLVIHHLIDRPNAIINGVLTTLAAFIFIQNAVLLGFGPRAKSLPPIIPDVLTFAGTSLSKHDLLIIIIAPTALVLLFLFLKRTRLGAAIRSVEQNRDAALLMGINVGFIYALTFGISTVLAALSGIMMGSIYLVVPAMGMTLFEKGLIVVILGGLGSLKGTILAAYVVGLIEAACIYIWGMFWAPVILFALMIGILLVKPSGLWGGEI